MGRPDSHNRIKWLKYIWKIPYYECLDACMVIYRVFEGLDERKFQGAREVQLYCSLLLQLLGEYPADTGGCRKFSEHLIHSLEGAEIHYNGNHTLVLYEGLYFDLWGVYNKEEARNILTGEIPDMHTLNFIHEDHYGRNYFKQFHLL